jgi:hypothetical protein
MTEAAASKKVLRINDVKVKLDPTSTVVLSAQVQSQIISKDELLATATAFWSNCSAEVRMSFMTTFRNRDDLVMSSIFLGILYFEHSVDGIWSMSSVAEWDYAVSDLMNRFFHDI